MSSSSTLPRRRPAQADAQTLLEARRMKQEQELALRRREQRELQFAQKRFASRGRGRGRQARKRPLPSGPANAEDDGEVDLRPKFRRVERGYVDGEKIDASYYGYDDDQDVVMRDAETGPGYPSTGNAQTLDQVAPDYTRTGEEYSRTGQEYPRTRQEYAQEYPRTEQEYPRTGQEYPRQEYPRQDQAEYPQNSPRRAPNGQPIPDAILPLAGYEEEEEDRSTAMVPATAVDSDSDIPTVRLVPVDGGEGDDAPYPQPGAFQPPAQPVGPGSGDTSIRAIPQDLPTSYGGDLDDNEDGFARVPVVMTHANGRELASGPVAVPGYGGDQRYVDTTRGETTDGFLGRPTSSVSVSGPMYRKRRPQTPPPLTSTSSPYLLGPPSTTDVAPDDEFPAAQDLPPAVSLLSYTERLNVRRVMLTLLASLPLDSCSGTRKFVGLKTFFNYYFASALKMFLGKRSVVRIFSINARRDFCAKLYRLDDGTRFVLTIVANFDYWDCLLGVMTALPDAYFRLAKDGLSLTRTYLRQATGVRAQRMMRGTIPTSLSAEQLARYGPDFSGQPRDLDDSASMFAPTETVEEPEGAARTVTINGQQVIMRSVCPHNIFRHREPPAAAAPAAAAQPHPPPNGQQPNFRSLWANSDQPSQSPPSAQPDDETDETALEVDKAVGALCLTHIVETLIEKDLRVKVPNYVSLAQMFARDRNAVRPFRIELVTR